MTDVTTPAEPTLVQQNTDITVYDGTPLALFLAPGDIRTHFDGDDEYHDRIAALTDEQLGEVASAVLWGDILYEAFHRALVTELDDLYPA